MAERSALELHKALADETRHRLYRYIGLAGRPVSVREMSRRLSLHPNTLRPHLRRLEEAGLVVREVRRGAVGRPESLYTVREPDEDRGGEYRLLAEMLAGLVRGKRALAQAEKLAREWGRYLVGHDRPKPGTRSPAGRNLALFQEAMARAGFDPRFRRRAGGGVDVSMRRCPFRDMAPEHPDLVCTLHRGLIEGIVAGLEPPMRVVEFEASPQRGTCRVRAE